jgi:hypothetical protein
MGQDRKQDLQHRTDDYGAYCDGSIDHVDLRPGLSIATNFCRMTLP